MSFGQNDRQLIPNTLPKLPNDTFHKSPSNSGVHTASASAAYPLLRDSLFVSYCLTMATIGCMLHALIRDFIRSKPEGKITAVAKIHSKASYALQFYSTAMLMFPCVRVVFGFFPLSLVIAKVKSLDIM